MKKILMLLTLFVLVGAGCASTRDAVNTMQIENISDQDKTTVTGGTVSGIAGEKNTVKSEVKIVE